MSEEQKVPDTAIDSSRLLAAISRIRNVCDEGVQLIQADHQNAAGFSQLIGNLEKTVKDYRHEIRVLREVVNEAMPGEHAASKQIASEPSKKPRQFFSDTVEEVAQMRKKQRVLESCK